MPKFPKTHGDLAQEERAW